MKKKKSGLKKGDNRKPNNRKSDNRSNTWPKGVEAAFRKVRTYLDSLPKPSKPERNPEELKQDRLSDLEDQYLLVQGYITETLQVLGTITGNKCDLPNLDFTLHELTLKTEAAENIVREAFKIGSMTN